MSMMKGTSAGPLNFFFHVKGIRWQQHTADRMRLKKIEAEEFDLVITDLKMEGISGMEVLERAVALRPNMIVIIMTAFGSVESAVEAMKKGAGDYIGKPFINEDVKMTVKRLLEHKKVLMENLVLRQQLSQQFGCKGVCGRFPPDPECF